MLNISVAQEQARVPVAVMGLEGELDAANYMQVIERARELAAQGTQNMVLDLSDLTYMGSSGLFAIHSVAMLLRGEAPPDPEGGWGAIHALGGGKSETVDCLKLLAPQPQVDRVLERTGMKRYYTVFSDKSEALGSF